MPAMQWKPDGKKMFEKILGAIPDAMREIVKPKLLEFLSAKAAGKPVTAEVVTRMVKEDVPEPQKSTLMQVLGIKQPAKPKQKEAAPASPQVPRATGKGGWEGNSQSMFERMIQEVPEALREVFRGKLMDILTQKAQGGPFKEAQVVEIVNEIVPEPFKSSILKAFSTMGGVDEKAVAKIIDDHPGGQESIISLLHALKDRFGYVPPEALGMVSQKKGIFMSALSRLVTSYQAFRTEPAKKYPVTVCNGTGCHLKGGGTLLKKLEGKVSEADSEITLEKVRCLGCCDLSPAIMVDGVVYGGADAEHKTSEILGE